jgi:outer membrane protein assembly factor BamB
MRRVAGFSTLLSAALLAGCSSMPDPFGMFESDNQAPPAELTAFTPTLEVRTLWSVDAGEGSEDQYLRLFPIESQGRLLVADSEGAVRAIETETGRTVWQVDTEAPLSGGPGLGDGLVLLGTRDAEVIALNEADGTQVWRTRLSSEVLSVPRGSGGIVVTHTIDGKLFGLNASDGSRVWVYDRTVPILTLRGNSSPVIRRNEVLAGFANGKLVSLNLSNGTPLWETLVTPPRGRSELERIVDIDADPFIYDGIAYVCTYQGEVAAVSMDTGVVLWRRDLSSHAGVSADWRALYVTDDQDRVWALDAGNGAALWRQEKLLNRRLSAPAIIDDYIVVGDLEGYLHWLNYEDGAFVARTELADAPISAKPLVIGEVVYVYADDGTLSAVSFKAAEPAPGS